MQNNRYYCHPPHIDPQDLTILPLECATTIPSAWYTDPGFHDVDRRTIFERTWQPIGRASSLAEHGSRIISMVAGHPVVAVRDNNDIRAFYNVCRHRGGPIATDTGCSSVLQCRYHGWTYCLDGSLRGVPKWDRVELFDRGEFGLVPVRISEWGGFLFVNLDPDEPVPLSDVMSGIEPRIAPINLRSKIFHSRVEYEVACNWKVYVDNYLEGYHVPLVHPGLFGMLDYNAYSTQTFGHHSLQHSPLRPGESVFSERGSDAFYYCIFPNFMLNILPGRLQTNLVLPISHDRCKVIFEYFYHDLTSPEAATIIAADINSADITQHEDIGICEHVQRGLASPAYDKGRFSVECEAGVHHFQNLVRRAYGLNIV